MPPPLLKSEQAAALQAIPVDHEATEYDIDSDDDELEPDEHEEESHFSASIKFLLAGGIAGAGKSGFYAEL